MFPSTVINKKVSFDYAHKKMTIKHRSGKKMCE